MLPGFRFLFAAIMLSMSLLVFGLGAAALLRAAHESFASNSSWRAAPEFPFAQHPDTTLPMLATLRVEPATMEKANEPAKAAAPIDQLPSAAESAGSEQVAALKPAETPPAENAKPADVPLPMPLAENPPVPEATPAAAASSTGETANAADEQKVTAVAAIDTAPAKSEPAAPQAEPANPAFASSTTGTSATASETDVVTMKIATLGGPPVDVSDDASVLDIRSVKLPRARPDASAIKKRVQARRALRRRLAARARLLALQQLQANPFGQQPQPFPPVPPRQQ